MGVVVTARLGEDRGLVFQPVGQQVQRDIGGGVAAPLGTAVAGEANHTQLGDPVKGAALIHEVVSQDKLPTHLYLGPDTIDRLQVMLARIEDDLAPWRAKSAATAHDDAA